MKYKVLLNPVLNNHVDRVKVHHYWHTSEVGHHDIEKAEVTSPAVREIDLVALHELDSFGVNEGAGFLVVYFELVPEEVKHRYEKLTELREGAELDKGRPDVDEPVSGGVLIALGKEERGSE